VLGHYRRGHFGSKGQDFMNRSAFAQIKVLAIIILLLGLTMLVYWWMYGLQGLPLAGIPVLSELVNAALVLVSGIGLLRLRKWNTPFSLFTAGMWAYGVLGSIQLVLEHGLDFASPFGAFVMQSYSP
jgi:hypothetical protein